MRNFNVVQVEPSAGVLAGLTALLTSFWHLHIVTLGILAVVASCFDLAAGAYRARVRHRLKLSGGFDRRILDEGMWGKAFVFGALVFLGMSADILAVLFGGLGSLDVSDFFAAKSPILTAALAFWFAKETGSLVDNISETPGLEDRLPEWIKSVIAKVAPLSRSREHWVASLTAEDRQMIRTLLESVEVSQVDMRDMGDTLDDF